MTQSERRLYLITELKKENSQYAELPVPSDTAEQKLLLRALFNVRMPKAASDEFLKIQDEYLREETRLKGVTDISAFTPIQPDIYLWQGDITTLKCDAIVNAANNQMLGCFCPNHGCIDNAIHTYAGVQLRLDCAELMAKQRHDEPTGQAVRHTADFRFSIPLSGIIFFRSVSCYSSFMIAFCGQTKKQFPQCRQCSLIITAGVFSKSIQFCGQTVLHFLQPLQRSVIT